MRSNKPSTTARIVAFWRALADRGLSVVPGFSDPYAQLFLDGGWSWGLSVLSWVTTYVPPEGRARLAAGFGVMPIRVAFIDEELLAAVRAGITQFVLLGAGLDTRAWRFSSLAGTSWYEVDHPASQASKRKFLARLPKPVVPPTWVPVDFEQDDLAPALAAAGHRTDKPTLWIWEGVVMYLGDQALRSTLTRVREASCAGSVLVLHYHEPMPTSARSRLRGALFSMLREPQIGMRTQAVIARELEHAGFMIDNDADILAQAVATRASAPEAASARISRVCVARVSSGGLLEPSAVRTGRAG